MKLNVTILEDEATHAAQLKQLRKDGFCGNIIFLTAFSEYFFDG